MRGGGEELLTKSLVIFSRRENFKIIMLNFKFTKNRGLSKQRSLRSQPAGQKHPGSKIFKKRCFKCAQNC